MTGPTDAAPADPGTDLATALGVDPATVDVGTTDGATADAPGTPCVTVPHEHWEAAARHARDAWGCTYFDWLSAVDQTDADPDPGVDVVTHVVRLPHAGAPLWRVLLRTRVPAATPAVASLTGVYAGAAWHERETREMFGLDFTGYDDGTGEGLRPLLLPDGFEGTPLRKQFQLASRAVKPWPGAKDPGDSGQEAASPSRRKLLPPAVPDATTWGPRRPDGWTAPHADTADADTPDADVQDAAGDQERPTQDTPGPDATAAGGDAPAAAGDADGPRPDADGGDGRA